jgi:methionine synthase II (cobalamin-independent)
VAGPWTLAATMERPRGDRVLADSGARRDVAQSLAEGVSELVLEMRHRLPDATPLVQLDEPMLPAVLAGSVPTASGLSRHRSIDVPEVSGTLSQLVARLGDTAESDVLVHCCAADPPIELLRRTGARGVLVDLDQLGRAEWDAIGPALEAGWEVGLGALPTRQTLTADQLARRVLPALRDLGVDPAQFSQLILTPACGLASATQSDAVAGLRSLRAAADIVSEQLAS